MSSPHQSKRPCWRIFYSDSGIRQCRINDVLQSWANLKKKAARLRIPRTDTELRFAFFNVFDRVSIYGTGIWVWLKRGRDQGFGVAKHAGQGASESKGSSFETRQIARVPSRGPSIRRTIALDGLPSWDSITTLCPSGNRAIRPAKL
jgi:hypothetical protein